MAFGHWDKAAAQLELIQNKDSVYSLSNMDFRNGLLFFVKGMDAISNNKVDEAIKLTGNCSE